MSRLQSRCQKSLAKRDCHADNASLITELSPDYVLDNYRSISKYSLNNINSILLSSILLTQRTENFTISWERCPPNADYAVDVLSRTAMPNIASVSELGKPVERTVAVLSVTTVS